MIIAAWKPKTKTVKGKQTLIYFEKVDIENITYRSPGNIKIIYKCDNPNCKYPDKIHSIGLNHLKNAKFDPNYHAKNNLEEQICRSCKSNGKNNGMYGKTHTKEIREKLKENGYNCKFTMIEKYGVENISLLDEIKKKKNQFIVNFNNIDKFIKENKIPLKLLDIKGHNKYAKLKLMCKEGHIFKRKWVSLRSGHICCRKCFFNRLREQGIQNKKEFGLYYRRVYQYTSKSVRFYGEKINNLEKRNREWHLDHKYSIAQGFIDNIPSYIIGSYHNLEVIEGIENMKKQQNCSITKEELFEQYFKGEYKWN